MKVNDLLDMIGNADDGIIEEAKKRKKPAAAKSPQNLSRCLMLLQCCLIRFSAEAVKTDRQIMVTRQNGVCCQFFKESRNANEKY